MDQFYQKMHKASSIFTVLEKQISPTLKATFKAFKKDPRKQIETGLKRLLLVFKGQQRANLSLLKFAAAGNKFDLAVQDQVKKLLPMLLRYHTSITAVRNSAWLALKRPIVQQG